MTLSHTYCKTPETKQSVCTLQVCKQKKYWEDLNIYENNNLYNSTTCTIHNTRKAKESKTLSKNFVYPPAKMNQVYKELLT